ncbi:MAG: hypothetical protein SLRJCFUN_000958, partial [Candidatus Fervidibacter sp.]
MGATQRAGTKEVTEMLLRRLVIEDEGQTL